MDTSIRKTLFAAALLLAAAPAAMAGQFLALATDPEARAGATSANGCWLSAGPATGTLARSSGNNCGDGQLGFIDPATENAAMEPGTIHPEPSTQPSASLFRSAIHPKPTPVGGLAQFSIFYAEEAGGVNPPPGNGAQQSRPAMRFHLDEVESNGRVLHIASGVGIESLGTSLYYGSDHPGVKHSGSIFLPEYTLKPGSRLRLQLGADKQSSASGRLLFGKTYEESGITLASDDGGSSAGALPLAGLLAGLCLGLVRRRGLAVG